MSSKNDSTVEVSVIAINENLAISEAAKQAELPHPWVQYWSDKRFAQAINAEKNGPYNWLVTIDKNQVKEIQNST
ncbi:MAG: hypothetical protein GF350_06950 [Chitinivibrionales bacterium]|nr:hypothetical protein [Chitinivibrionales bacterium]